MRAPASVEPVIEIMSTSGCTQSASPTVRPGPVTRLKTPAGSPTSWMISASTNALSGVSELGLSTMVQPATNAGATLPMIWWSG